MRNTIFPHNFEDHLGFHASVIFQTQIWVVSGTLVCWFDPKTLWSIGRINALYHSTRVDLYSHQILLRGPEFLIGPYDQFYFLLWLFKCGLW